ncbi:DUF4890 domain-containing protein [Dysgonomonas sp. Marseille-P4677]|uniref:DUF4890 domain-containing protein n=1 Tax=Dysgonomonas sp. Marseille-P4677 TaxID=2364790 RepID=UPI001911733F|nr:DUF4890 domain-containing protein [Dysgonomonas sp. Marseille-P4677]MBK5721265.1 DUF4890 domain-containing protein [Dysgonomonas sp. Marseille-P4677]
MKKLVLFLTIALFTTSGLMAQQRQRATPEERAKRQTETLAKELSLTDDQKAKVYEINLKYAQPKEGQAKSTDREAMRAEFQKNMEERTAALKTVLTEDQQKKLDEHLKKMQENRPRRN